MGNRVSVLAKERIQELERIIYKLRNGIKLGSNENRLVTDILLHYESVPYWREQGGSNVQT